MDKLTEMVAEVLGMEPGQIEPETSRENCEKWDSLAHLNLIAVFEERLGVKVPFEGIVNIHKVKDFLPYMERKK